MYIYRSLSFLHTALLIFKIKGEEKKAPNILELKKKKKF
uniref:Uncharacterized protein n=1 Tax=Manihot esculenta TaxID=3983 RepID=A0A2C9V5T7_MANES